MTQAVETPYAITTGDDVTVAFPFTFTVASSAELEVRLITTATGAIGNALVLNTDYTVSLTQSGSVYSGGTVTMTTAPASTQKLWIRRVTALDQDVDIAQAGNLNTAGVENELDKIIRVLQEHDTRLDTLPTIDPSAGGFTVPAPSSTYNNYFLGVVSGVYAFVQAVTSTVLAFSGNVAGRIAYFGGTSTISGDSGFTYNDSTDTLSVPNATISGDIRNTQLTASRVVVTDADKDLASSAVTATELGHLSGVTSPVQTQLDAKLAVLARTSNVSVTGTTSETTLLTSSIAGGTLGTNKAIRFTGVAYFYTDGGPDAFILRFKYGGTTLSTVTISVSNGPLSGQVVITAFLCADGATNDQRGTMVVQERDASTSGALTTTLISSGDGAVDSTSSQNLVVSVQPDDTDNTFKLYWGAYELV